jgi:hypothetical protein
LRNLRRGLAAAGRSDPAQEGVEPGVVFGAGDVDEFVKIIRGGAEQPGGRRARGRHPIEPVQHLHAEPIVEAVALAALPAVVDVRLDASIDGAIEKVVGNGGRGGDQGGAPSIVERFAFRAGPKGIGALAAHAGSAR